MKLEISFAFIGLLFSLPYTPVLAQSQTITQSPKNTPVRVAIMPFCNESNVTDSTFQFDPKKIYNQTLGAIRTLGKCQKPLALVSKNRAAQAILMHSTEMETSPGDAFCDHYLTDVVCKEFGADILVLGEYIINPDSSVDVYYSFENCEGIYNSDVSYQTPQPIQGSLHKSAQLYQEVAQAIRKDLEVFSECKESIDLNTLLAEGLEWYRKGDSVGTAYLAAIQRFNLIVQYDPFHQQALYHLGLSYFSIDQLIEAQSYFERVVAYEDAQEYLTFCALGTKPATWYSTHSRRMQWWESLSDAWKGIFQNHILKTKGGRLPSEVQLEDLFARSLLTIENVRLPDLSGIEALTNLTQLRLSRTRLKSLKGIEKLQRLGQLYCSGNQLKSLEGIEQLPVLTRVYCRNNPLESLTGIDEIRRDNFVVFCGQNIPQEELVRVRALGINLQP